MTYKSTIFIWGILRGGGHCPFQSLMNFISSGFIGVNAERVDYNGTKFVVFDVGGRERMVFF